MYFIFYLVNIYVIWRSVPNIIALVKWGEKIRTQRNVIRTEHEACANINVFQTKRTVMIPQYLGSFSVYGRYCTT